MTSITQLEYNKTISKVITDLIKMLNDLKKAYTELERANPTAKKAEASFRQAFENIRGYLKDNLVSQSINLMLRKNDTRLLSLLENIFEQQKFSLTENQEIGLIIDELLKIIYHTTVEDIRSYRKYPRKQKKRLKSNLKKLVNQEIDELKLIITYLSIGESSIEQTEIKNLVELDDFESIVESKKKKKPRFINSVLRRKKQTNKNQQKRQVNCWIEPEELPLKVDKDYQFWVNIGSPRDSTLTNWEFPEPDWGDRKHLDLLIRLSSIEVDIEPSWRNVILKKDEDMSPINFKITPRKEGSITLYLSVFLEPELALIEKYSLSLEAIIKSEILV